MIKFRYILLSILFLSILPLSAQNTCNQWPLVNCIGNALEFTKNQGQSAHFVNLTNSPSLNTITTEMTVEMWVKPNIEAGRRNYLAGKWGPTVDKSDVWQLYFDTDGSIVFELNHPTEELDKEDNTIAKTQPLNLNGEWHHIAAIFKGDSNKAIIYLDGERVAEAVNDSIPISILKNHGNDTQFGRANEFTNDNSYRTFRGLMDEIRLWNRAIPETELFCEKDKQRAGNESGLVAYFRCNEAPGVVQICDVTQNNNGLLLSGLKTTNQNDRPESYPYIVSEPKLVDTLKCDTRKKYSITVTDTSLCGSAARLWIRNDFSSYFDFDGSFKTLPPGQAVTFEFYIDNDFTGQINPIIRVLRNNRCGFDFLPGNKRRWTINRITELDYSVDTLGLGILKAHCLQEPYTEKTFKVCNNTEVVGTNRDITVTAYNLNLPQYYSVESPSVPFTLKPGECRDVTVRFTSGSTAGIFYDTLRFESNDQCEGGGEIPLTGAVEDIISITTQGTDGGRLDSVDFGTVCKDFPSGSVRFYWENLSSSNIKVVDVEVPPQYEFYRFNGPQTLEPNKSYQYKLIRFYPNQTGTFQDTVFIVVEAGNCTLRRPIVVKGKSIHPDIRFTVDTVDFGNVFVGQEREERIKIENFGEDEFRVSFSLLRGDAFYFPGGRFATIPPGEEREVRVRFRPVTDSLYFDQLCFQETAQTGCYSSGCITVRGQGIIDKFDFDPKIMKIENVVACEDSTNTIRILNESPVDLDLNNFNLNDPSGKFSVLEPVSSLTDLGNYSTTLPAGESLEFKFRYTPNDLTQDRADKAYLEFSDEDGEEWAAKLQGSSALPKLFIQDNNAFGTYEVGERPTKEIVLENISTLSIHLDSLSIGNGFNILYPGNIIDKELAPRDTIHIIVEFVPTQAVDYATDIKAYSSKPCPVENSASFSGRGKVVPIEIISTLVTFGFVKNCECDTTKITMANNSKVNDAIIDSVWLDGGGIPNAYPHYFSWTSDYANNGNELPYSIPPLTKDTLRVQYCPKSPAMRDSVNHSAMLHIDAHGISQDGNTLVWELEEPYDRFLTGKQQLMYEPAPFFTQFPPTLVDNFADPEYKVITIPGIAFNPDRSTIVIDSISFEPAERVFFASDALGRDFPIVHSAEDDTLRIQVDFKPRVFRDYEAKVKVHFREPCEGFDTTMTVFGSGFATPFTMPFDFHSADSVVNQYNVISCDTLELPVYASRKVPAELIDIDTRISYDTTLFDFIGYESKYIGFNGDPEEDVCTQFPANMDILDVKDSSRIEVKLKNFCQIDSIDPMFIAKFVPKVNQTVTSTFSLDSFYFDSEDVILFRLLPEYAEIDVRILNSDVEILNEVDYDSVRVLDCKVDTFVVQNTGDVDFRVADILNLPDDVRVIDVQPPLNDTLRPGEITEVVIEFCPLQTGEYLTYGGSEIFDPCYMYDSTRVRGFGYAPEFELQSDVSTNFDVVDTLFGLIGKQVTIPIYIDKDITATYKGIEHWMIDMKFDANIEYEKRALKFLEARNTLGKGNFDYNLTEHGSLTLNYEDVDTLRAGQIAEVDFTVVIPQDINTALTVSASNFGSEYIYFLEINNSAKDALFNTGQSCEISHVVYTGGNAELEQNRPNPWSNSTTIDIKLNEKSKPVLELYDPSGKRIKILLDGSIEFENDFSIDVNSSDIRPGLYYYQLQVNGETKTKSMILIE